MQIQVTIQSNHKLSAYRDRKPRTRQEEQNRAEQDWQKKAKQDRHEQKQIRGKRHKRLPLILCFTGLRLEFPSESRSAEDGCVRLLEL